jgi:N-acyl-D-amino-acid deacylase
MYSLVLKNATVIDGTGKPAYQADLGIAGDKIAAIGEIQQAENAVDVSGMVVTPGFIDPHSHADCSIFLYPDCESYVRQGITTFVGGQCGDSNAPIRRYWMRKYWEYDMWDAIDPYIYGQTTIQPVEKAIAGIEKKAGIRIDWRSFGEYLDRVERQGMGCNMITLLGHSQVRADVMGLDQRRAPTPREMDEMKACVDEAMACGAWGLSTGRDYPPSAYADPAEIIELMRHAGRQGGMYFTHWKRTGVRVGTPEKPNKLAGIVEALEIGMAAGVKTQVSHISTGFDIYPPNEDMDLYAAKVTLDIFDGYLQKGAQAAFDVIPGRSGGIAMIPFLASKLMPWVRQAGSLSGFIRNLGARDFRTELIEKLEGGAWYALNPKVNPCWDEAISIGPSQNPKYAGKTLREIGRLLGTSSMEAVMALLLEEPRIPIEENKKSDGEIRGLLAHPKGSPCTDTYAFDLEGTYGRDMELPELLPHPHTYCAFPKYILQFPAPTLEETIRKMTGAVAQFLEIPGRGEIQVGNFADLVVLDLKRLKTNENYVEPRVYPEGIPMVVVNGVVEVDQQGFTGRRAGRILRHQ